MVRVVIDVALDYTLVAPSAAILFIEAANSDAQTVQDASIEFGNADLVTRVPADEGIGERIMLHCNQTVQCRYHSVVEVSRPNHRLEELAQIPVEKLSGDALRYIMPSRYCESDRFRAFVTRRFGHLDNGVKVAAIRDWINAELNYVPGISHSTTTAEDTFIDRRGVCRDYAHLMIAMCRSVHIPARICSAYAASVDPQDFHAVVEVYLSDRWHLVDPTGMATASEMVVIGVGRDATDVAFMTTISVAEMHNQSIMVSQNTD